MLNIESRLHKLILRSRGIMAESEDSRNEIQLYNLDQRPTKKSS